MRKNFKHVTSLGFTLIELSIVIIILGLLSAALLNMYNTYTKQKELTVTADNIKAVQNAFQTFKDKEGFYPCPADPADASGKATDCAQPAPAGIKVASGTDGREVRIGVVPVLDLSGETKLLQKAQADDGWRNRLTYAVTTNLAIDSLTFVAAAGGITVVNAAGAPLSNNVGMIVLSHGDDGQGAYAVGGTQAKVCETDKKDAENCNNDAVFMSDARSYGHNAEYTDDYLDFETATPRTILGPCTLFWNMNNSDSNQSATGNSAFASGGVIANAGTQNLYLGRLNRPVDYATMYNALFPGGPGTGTIYSGTDSFIGTTEETFPVDSPEALSKLFEFKAVDPRTEQVVCINTAKPAPSNNNGGSNSGSGGDNSGSSGGGSGSSGNGGHGGNDGDGGASGGDGNNGM